MRETSEAIAGQGAATRAVIAASAREMFTDNGYAGTSVRAIAGVAGIDAALVIRYFGSKERLFLETMQLPGFLERALPGPVESLGERIVAAVFDGDVEARLSVFAAMMRAPDSDELRHQMNATGDRTLVRPLAGRLEGPDAPLRARLIAAQITGLLCALAFGEDTELAVTTREETVRTYGRAIQSLIDPPR